MSNEKIKNLQLFITQMIKPIVASMFFIITNAEATNSMLETVPSIQIWVGGNGNYTAVNGSNVIINSDSILSSTTLAGITTNVSDTAAHFIIDLKAISDLDFTVLNNNSPSTGDILLTLLNNNNSTIGDEGYILEIGDFIEIKANSNTGLFYGTQTILQALKNDDDHKDIKQGNATDFPSLPERGIMIDAGRKYWGVDYLKDLVRTLGWQKLNRIHLHFTDWNAFRLSSANPALAGLAAIGSYTKLEIDELEALAKKHHVVIVPEIDIPGHAKLLGDFSKENAFSCNSMSSPNLAWEGSSGPRWTLDYTGVSTNSPNTGRDFLNNLIDEFVPWFDGPYFHIGTDEVPEDSKLNNCLEITNYIADTPSLTKNGDVLVEFIDEANTRIKALGKKTQMWNWYERQNTSIAPINDILVDVWAGNSENDYINLGFNVIKTGPSGFYLTPGLVDKFPSNNTIYTWNNTSSNHLKGIKVSVWTDAAYTWPDHQFENLLFDSRSITAERNWKGAQSSSTLNAFLSKARSLGLPVTLSGEKNSISKEKWTVLNVSSEETSSEDGKAGNVFDGLGTTIWHSNYSNGNNDIFPYNLDIDMGENYDLYGARFQARRNQGSAQNGVIDSYDFSVSSDGINWTVVVENGTFYNIENIRKARTIDFPKQTARYVRFTAKSATNGKRLASLAELDIFGTTVGGSPIVREYAKIQIRSKTDMSFCLGVDRESGSVNNGDTIKLRSCLNTDNYQVWERRDEGQGYASIRLADDNSKCLDVKRGSDNVVNASDSLVVWNCHLGDNQLWKIDAKSNGFFNIQTKGNASVCAEIDITAVPDLTPNDNIKLQTCSSINQQQWVLVE